MFSLLSSPEKVAKASETLMQIKAASPSKAAAQILTDIKMQQHAQRTLFAEQPAPKKSLGKRKIVEIQQQPPAPQPLAVPDVATEPAQKKARVAKKDPQTAKNDISLKALAEKITPYSEEEIKKISRYRKSPNGKHIVYIRDLIDELYQRSEPVKRIRNLVCSLFEHQKTTLLSHTLDKICAVEKARWPSRTIPKPNKRLEITIPSATEKMHAFLKIYKQGNTPGMDYVNVTIEKSL